MNHPVYVKCIAQTKLYLRLLFNSYKYGETVKLWFGLKMADHFNGHILRYVLYMPIPVAALCKVLVCGHSLAGILGSKPAGGMDVCLLWVLCVIK
jgi:hypothetical protein